ncbi:glycerophosphodiester phosphodiesterase [Paenibacillus tarimensis]|uniref:glycerophosphodiester phosphodiesterase n=1 Tax=Paenibacillus tarimensis TaxID=416012 RepID=UPI001F30FEAB|nr:glycerophosphodiester phosphodiesterase [Paenibacillus tarimensis]MCF2945048.1 glycerophosphodiester phosphodiesterase [Paenibacillus tarimensis]
MSHNIINYAHRGASGTSPENTMAAFKRAVELGATGIETDVQMSRDGMLVLIHDESLKRTTGAEGMVGAADFAELSQLDAGAWFGPEFAGERIPLLEELLELGKQYRLTINIELKNGMVSYPGMEEAVIAAVEAHGMEKQVILSSFNHYSMVHCKQLAPGIRTGLLYMEGLYRPWDYAISAAADALHPYYPAAMPEWIAEAKRHGVICNPFTVNDPAIMKRLIKAGAAGIITDYPDRLAALLAEEGA